MTANPNPNASTGPLTFPDPPRAQLDRALTELVERARSVIAARAVEYPGRRLEPGILSIVARGTNVHSFADADGEALVANLTRENELLRLEATARRAWARATVEVTRILSTNELAGALTELALIVRELLGASQAYLVQPTTDHRWLSVSASSGRPSAVGVGDRISRFDAVDSRMLAGTVPARLGGSGDRPILALSRHVGPVMYVPVGVAHGIGILVVVRAPEQGPFTDFDLEMASALCGTAALAVELAIAREGIRVLGPTRARPSAATVAVPSPPPRPTVPATRFVATPSGAGYDPDGTGHLAELPSPGPAPHPNRRGGRIVVGVDGSDPSIAALKRAVRIATALEASVEAITTWVYPVGYADLGATAYSPEADAIAILDSAGRSAFDGTPPDWFTPVALEGHADRVLIERSAGAEMLVLGSRGHSGLAGVLLGSVSSACAEHAKCPVLIMH